MMFKDSKGITLIALSITIIVLLVLAGITISGGKESIKMSRANKLLTELDMIQHACLERYAEYKLTKNESLLKGEPIEYSVAQELANSMGHTNDFPANNDGTFYELNEDALSDLGFSNIEDTYIVNYEKGIVMNKTTQTTTKGVFLYKSSN